MSLDRISNPGPPALESDALSIALCGPTSDLKGQKLNTICTMDGVQEDILRPPNGTTPAAMMSIKIF